MDARGIWVNNYPTLSGLSGLPELLCDFFLLEAKPVPVLFFSAASDAEVPAGALGCVLSAGCFFEEARGLSRYTTSSMAGLTIFSRMKSEEVMLLTE